MKKRKTSQSRRETYKLYDDNGKFITEYKPGADGVTEIDIIAMHKIDDHEIYINSKEMKLPEWYQPVYNEWKEKFAAKFRAQHGREPFVDEIPGRHRILESVDFMAEDDDEEFGDRSHLHEKIAVSDDEDVPDAIVRLREIVAEMPETWKKVYNLVCIEGFSKAETGRIIGISDSRVGQIVKKINKKISNDEILKKIFK